MLLCTCWILAHGPKFDNMCSKLSTLAAHFPGLLTNVAVAVGHMGSPESAPGAGGPHAAAATLGWNRRLSCHIRVEPMTLKALVRERLESGQEMPSDLFNVFAGNRTKVTRSK